MPDYAAFLRAVNLGSQRRVSGAELRSLFEELGFSDVSTFRTSGNVVFGADEKPSAERIEKGLEASLGYEVGVFLRTAGEVRSIAEHEPFDAAVVEASKGKLQVVMLTAKPAAKARKAVLALATDEDRLAFGQREIYWLPSAGTQESALDFKAIHELIGSTTMRTKGTVELIAAKYFSA